MKVVTIGLFAVVALAFQNGDAHADPGASDMPDSEMTSAGCAWTEAQYREELTKQECTARLFNLERDVEFCREAGLSGRELIVHRSCSATPSLVRKSTR